MQALAPGKLDLVWYKDAFCVMQLTQKESPYFGTEGPMSRWRLCLRLGKEPPDNRFLPALYEMRIDPTTGMTAGDRKKWAEARNRARTEAKRLVEQEMNSPETGEVLHRVRFDNRFRAQLGLGASVIMPGAATTAAPLLPSSPVEEVACGDAVDPRADAHPGEGAAA